MSTPNPVLSTLIFVFAFQAIILSVLLVLKKPRRQANLFLALLVFFFALMAFNIALINALIAEDSFHIFRYFQLELLFGMGPALFLYTKSITNQSYRFFGRQYLHFLPVVLEFIFYRTAFYRLGADGLYTDPPHPYTKIYLAEQWLGIISVSVYTILSLRQLYIHQRVIKQQYSNLENRSMSWLRIPTFFYAGYWILWNVLTEIDRFAFDRGLRDAYFLPAFLGLSVVSCWIGFKGYLKTQSDTSINSQAYRKIDLKVDPNETEKITKLMEKQQPYLDPELDLSQLARLLEMKPKQLSATINQTFQKNFYDYVNSFRIEAFKRRLEKADHQHLTLLGLAYECGFKSKSTFNQVFKKMVGTTPRDYAKNLAKKSI